MPNQSFSFKSRIKSFVYAFSGIKYFFKTEHNAWIQVIVALIVVVMGYFLALSRTQWCWITVAIALVFMAEMINTAIELLTDMVSPEFNERAKKVKDMASGAVLIAAGAAAVIGLIVFSKAWLA